MKDYLIKDSWKVIEDSLHTEYNLVSESIASLGNGRLGGRGNFEEKFDGPTLRGSYIAGIYYPDKTKVGWWKNGYPEYFAKVINSVNWIGIDVWVGDYDYEMRSDGVVDFYAELDMREGVLRRTTISELPDGKQIKIESERFYSMCDKDQCYLKYTVTALNFSGKVSLAPYLDFNVRNTDSNYDEMFWNHLGHSAEQDFSYVSAETKKTHFRVTAGMISKYYINEKELRKQKEFSTQEGLVSHNLEVSLEEGDRFTVEKYCCITTSLYHDQENLESICRSQLAKASKDGYVAAYEKHKNEWSKIWSVCDIVIEGDPAAQQGIRFNIFQLYQTYTGDDARLNIGPKGFTGEKYGGVTYWDTEAYCIPFYLGTADSDVARNLLKYRYHHLDNAIKNASKLGFNNGAALFPMVTMNGEECHNEWEITFEEIHRNGAIAYAIYDYIKYTGDQKYLAEYGLEVLIAIARFWKQRVNWSEDKQRFVILGVTGPNEYENNVNNNWYTNYIASWCLQYTAESIKWVQQNHKSDYDRITDKTQLDAQNEPKRWQAIIDGMYYPEDKERQVFLQQDGFLDKELVPAEEIPDGEYPIHQHWSWDRILRSCFIKQADVLQGLYFFEDQFNKETIKRNFDFYEPLTVHESSLSPCVHSILAASIGRKEKAYEMYLRTARLDLDDYNNDTKDGLHITSMAGTWMALVKGFGGMRIKENHLSFNPFIPDKWTSYSFKIKFRRSVLQLTVTHEDINMINHSPNQISVVLAGEEKIIYPKEIKTTILTA